MRLNSTGWLIVLLGLGILSACQDHRLMPSPGFRLKKVISQARGYYTSTTFNYNSAGRLATYVFRLDTSSAVEATPGQTTLMQYDAQGRLISAEKQPAATAYALTRTTYEYDAAGNIVLVKTYADAQRTGTYTLTDEYRLEYGTTLFPIKVTTIRGANQDVQLYTYSAENVVKLNQSGNTGANRYETNLSGLLYDDKPNPFYKLITAGPDWLIYNKNNSLDSSNRYNANGLLISKVVRKIVGTTALNVTETYEYEPY